MRQGRRRVYAGVLDIPEGQSGKVSITHKLHPAGWQTQSGNFRTAMFGQKGESLTFAEPTRWHELSEEGQGTWMTDLPIEQRQMDELIQKAKGRVLVGGLGVGYAVVALSKRPAVKEIVVVEQNPDIIKLVWGSTLAKVDRPERCSVVCADLFVYLADLPKNSFAWALFDIWQSDGETCFHEVIVPLRKLAHEKVKAVVCWNEDIMRGQLLNGMHTRLMLLRMPKEAQEATGLAGGQIDLLCSDEDSPYIAWAAPFWRWYRDHGAAQSQDTVQELMVMYCKSYGRPELNDYHTWALRWHTPVEATA